MHTTLSWTLEFQDIMDALLIPGAYRFGRSSAPMVDSIIPFLLPHKTVAFISNQDQPCITSSGIVDVCKSLHQSDRDSIDHFINSFYIDILLIEATPELQQEVAWYKELMKQLHRCKQQKVSIIALH